MTDRNDNHDGMDGGPNTPRDAKDIAAAEYVLGLLEPEQHADVSRRLSTDDALLRRVAAWQRRLAPLLEDAPSEVARAGVLRRIEREIGASPSSAIAGAPPASSGVIVREDDVRRQKRDAARERRHVTRDVRPAPAARTGLWSSLAFWRGFSLAAIAACVALAVAVVTEQDLRRWYEPALAPLAERYGFDLPRGPLLAALGPAEGSSVFLLSYQGGRLSAQTVSTAAEERVPELWLLPEDGGAPRSLGLLPPPGAPEALPLGAVERAALDAGSTLAVSLEPLGGAPEGTPTGPIVAQGTLVRP